MPQFVLNKGGAMLACRPYNELNTFAKGYVEAMFFTNGDTGDDNEDRLNELGVEALSFGSVELIARYCARFEHYNATALEHAYQGLYDDAQAGRDLWFTAQGHGCGFWDREQLHRTTQALLTEGAKNAGEVDVEIGDNERIYYRVR